MIKRAHLYSCAPPIPDDVSNGIRDELHDSSKNNDKINIKNDINYEANSTNESDTLPNYPEFIAKATTKGKALKCKCCPGKLILNDRDLYKHLTSKIHKKRALTYKNTERKVEKAKHKFAKIIKQIEADSDNSYE